MENPTDVEIGSVLTAVTDRRYRPRPASAFAMPKASIGPQTSMAMMFG